MEEKNNNKENLISVIVPIYNVEQYLRECIDSIISQTYKNIEIILVDDGSTDSCPQICDEYKEKDNRIKVIHKKNEGVSLARNTGLNTAKGDYISFVDSDDIINEKLYEDAISNIRKYNLDIYCFNSIRFRDGERIKNRKILSKKDFIFLNSSKEIFKNYTSICDGIVNDGVWDKIYDKKLWNDVVFPVGKTCEDIYVLYKVYDRCNKYMFNGNIYYYYRQRNNSITHSDYKSINFNPIYANNELADYVIEKYPDLTLEMTTKRVFAYIGVYNNIIRFDSNNEKKDEILKLIREKYADVIKNKDLPIKRKIQYYLIVKHNKVYNKLLKK